MLWRMEPAGFGVGIVPDEETVVGIHLNLSGDVEVEVVLPGNRIRKSCPAGMRWIGNIPSLIK